MHSGKKAFTLAEVLITLAIIGVVAALTIPSVVAQYQKNVVITRLKKFYSSFNQALNLSQVDNGDMEGWKWGTPYDKTENVVFYETYLQKYLKVTRYDTYSEEKMPINGVRMFFADGSAAVLAGGYLTFYPVANKTKVMGKDVFSFSVNLTQGSLQPEGGTSYARSTYLSDKTLGCNSSALRRFCVALIMKDNWEIKDDYPW